METAFSENGKGQFNYSAAHNVHLELSFRRFFRYNEGTGKSRNETASDGHDIF